MILGHKNFLKVYWRIPLVFLWNMHWVDMLGTAHSENHLPHLENTNDVSSLPSLKFLKLFHYPLAHLLGLFWCNTKGLKHSAIYAHAKTKRICDKSYLFFVHPSNNQLAVPAGHSSRAAALMCLQVFSSLVPLLNFHAGHVQ
jgi:hypothetical protein